MADSAALMMKNTIFHEIDMFRAFIHSSNDLFTSHAKDGRFTYASPACSRLLGYEPAELAGKTIFEFCHPEDLPRIRQLFIHKAGHSAQCHYRILKKEGDYIWLETSCTPFMNKWSEEFMCLSRDITAFKLAEKDLRAEKEKFHLLTDNFQDTIGIITTEGFWIHMNSTGKKLFGATLVSEMIGKSLLDHIHPDDRDLLQMNLGPNAEPSSIECTIIRCDGKNRQALIQLIPSTFKDREVCQIVIRDVTEQRKAEILIERTEKLHVVGELAAGIAHEIRNPLTVIKGFTQLALEERHNSYLDVILGELERIEKITSDLLVLSKPQSRVIETVHIESLVEETLLLFRSEFLLHNIETVCEFSLQDPFLSGEAGKLKQVLINFVKNAVEAMPDGGKLLLKTGEEDGDAVIEVIDEGVGVPADLMQKLEEPFFSTKEKGTGLGLVICNQIIKQHKGAFSINSGENRGTAVRLQLPRK